MKRGTKAGVSCWILCLALAAPAARAAQGGWRPKELRVSGQAALNKLVVAGQDPGVFQCVDCTLSADFKYAYTQDGVAYYTAQTHMKDPTNNPNLPELGWTVTNPQSSGGPLVALFYDETKDAALIFLQTSQPFDISVSEWTEYVVSLVRFPIGNVSKLQDENDLTIPTEQWAWDLTVGPYQKILDLSPTLHVSIVR